LNVFALLAKDASDVLNVTSTANEGCKDHIHSILHTEFEVILVLFGQRRKIDIGPWKVDTFLRGDLAIVECPDTKCLVVDNLENFK
jgi:hypothetical protein